MTAGTVSMAGRPRTMLLSRVAVLVLLSLLLVACTQAGASHSTVTTAAVPTTNRPITPAPDLGTPAVPVQRTFTSLLSASRSVPEPDDAASAQKPDQDPAALLRTQHDAGFRPLLATLAGQLRIGARRQFLQPFAPSVRGPVGKWFDNTRALGVEAVLFGPSDNYSSGASDSARQFTRTVVLGIRTPYDDDRSMPGIPYAVGVSVALRAGKQVLTITSWAPKYLGDPMFCDCTVRVLRGERTAVVVDKANADLVFWSTDALRAAESGLTWSFGQLGETGLVAPKGTVIFLAAKPFHWFLSSTGQGQTSNITTPLLDAKGDNPGTRYSDQSRIVLQLRTKDGAVLPNNERGRQYLQDVVVHESTHQLMNRNSTLPGRNDNSPKTWVVEGIAVAMETLHRDALGAEAEIGYPQPNDPKNFYPAWLAAHLPDPSSKGWAPTKTQLRSGKDGAGYYAISGSVFRYLSQEYGHTEMLRVARAMYAAPARTPFAYFPDRDNPGSMLPVGTATQRWREWFRRTYL